MSNEALLIEWGMPRQGREHKAMEVFFAAQSNWEAWKAAGRFQSYQNFGTNTGDMEARSGFIIVQGTRDQLTALVNSEDYREQMVQVLSMASNVAVTHCETGDAMIARMQRYGKVLKGMAL